VIRKEHERWERPAELGPLEVTMTPVETFDASTLHQYEEIGVHRLVLLPRPDAPRSERHLPVPEPEILRNIELAAALL